MSDFFPTARPVDVTEDQRSPSTSLRPRIVGDQIEQAKTPGVSR